MPIVNSVNLNGVLDNTPQRFDFDWDLSFYRSNYLVGLNPLSGIDGLENGLKFGLGWESTIRSLMLGLLMALFPYLVI